jgi:hypothetical protein
MELVSPADVINAEGYLALFLAGWSPALWSVGYQIVSTPGDSDPEAASKPQNKCAPAAPLCGCTPVPNQATDCWNSLFH